MTPKASGANRRRPSSGSIFRGRSSTRTRTVRRAGFAAASSTAVGSRSIVTSISGRGDQTALIYDSPVTGTVRKYTFSELRDWVARVAGGLAELGVRQGRPRHRLHADGAGSGGGDARVRAHRCRALRGVRRIRGTGTCRSHRRRNAEGHSLRIVRHRVQRADSVQAAARRSDHVWRITSRPRA